MGWGLYAASVIVGIGAALIWTAQGNYLTLCSNDQTMSRNSSLFWALLQCSFLWGNIFVYFSFQSDDGDNTVTKSQRILTYSVLTGVGLVGVACFFFLGKPKKLEQTEDKDKDNTLSLDYLLDSLSKFLKFSFLRFFFIIFFYLFLEQKTPSIFSPIGKCNICCSCLFSLVLSLVFSQSFMVQPLEIPRIWIQKVVIQTNLLDFLVL